MRIDFDADTGDFAITIEPERDHAWTGLQMEAAFDPEIDFYNQQVVRVLRPLLTSLANRPKAMLVLLGLLLFLYGDQFSDRTGLRNLLFKRAHAALAQGADLRPPAE